MKDFSPSSIKDRMIASLKNNLDWNFFYETGVLSQLLTLQSEEEFELARYFEYLLRESMWAHARNASSVFSNAKMLGYNPLRKVSAIGTLYISHDPNIYTNINKADNITKRTLAKQILLYETTPTLENYIDIPLTEYGGSQIYIAIGTAITINGIAYITAIDYIYPDPTPITYEVQNFDITGTPATSGIITVGGEPITILDTDSEEDVADKIRAHDFEDWMASGSGVNIILTSDFYGSVATVTIDVGTTGLTVGSVTSETVTIIKNKKYLKLMVIQGTKAVVTTKNTSYQDIPALGEDYEQITLTNLNIEAAQNSYTQTFFDVLETNTGLAITYTPIDSILLAAYDDARFDIVTSTDFQTILRFGNNVTGVKLTTGSILQINFLSTLGSLGNVESLCNLVEFTVTPQTFTGINISSITGGSEGDSTALNNLNELIKIKERAPLQYLTINSIITTPAYKQAIEAYPSINQAVIYAGTYTSPGGTEKDCIYFSALYDDGSVPLASEIEDDIIAELAYKKPPLDILKFQTPALIPVRLYYKGEIQTAGHDIKTVRTSLFTYFQNLYSITNRTFKSKFSVANNYLNQIGVVSLVPDTRYISAEAILNFTSDDMISSGAGIATLEKSFENCFTFTDSYDYTLRIYIECSGISYVYYKYPDGDLKAYTANKNNIFPKDFMYIDSSELVDVTGADLIFKSTSYVTISSETVTLRLPSSIVDTGIIRIYAVIKDGVIEPDLDYQFVYIPDSTEGEQSSEIIVECTDSMENF